MAKPAYKSTQARGLAGYWVSPSKKRRDGRGFPRAGRAALRDFPRAKPEGYPEEQPCQPKENPLHPDSSTWISFYLK